MTDSGSNCPAVSARSILPPYGDWWGGRALYRDRVVVGNRGTTKSCIYSSLLLMSLHVLLAEKLMKFENGCPVAPFKKQYEQILIQKVFRLDPSFKVNSQSNISPFNDPSVWVTNKPKQI